VKKMSELTDDRLRARLRELQVEHHKLRARAAVEELKRKACREVPWLERQLRELQPVNHANFIESELDEWRRAVKTIRDVWRAWIGE
jgi:hypothetical protein